MRKGIDITIVDRKGNEARIDDDRYGAAVKQYDTKISELSSAEYDECLLTYSKSAATLDAYKAEQAEITRIVNEFNEYWAEQKADYTRECNQAIRTVTKMSRSKGSRKEAVEAFAREQEWLIKEKHKDVLAAHDRAITESQPILDNFKAKWDGNREIADYQAQYAAIRKKYKRLRRAVKKPNPFDYLILTKKADVGSDGDCQ